MVKVFTDDFVIFTILLELPMSHTPTRREFLIKVASASAVMTAGASLSACGGSSSSQPEFLYGVASGDPLADSVILWTHAKFPVVDIPVVLRYQVASDAAFTQIVSQGDAIATAENGHTAKVDAKGLTAGATYFYRFTCGETNSPVGRTRTLPAAGVTEVKLAVFSCSSFAHGYFSVYEAASSSDAQYALHLGDYIYEYKDGEYPDKAVQGRNVAPRTEITSLGDYRTRHAQQKSDPNLKNLHARMPMIAVWDDHEFTNDAYMTGAENHTEGAEGTFANRKAAALKAYHEWMPIRTGSDLGTIYRSFDFGTLLSLHMLDTRIVGREKQIPLTDIMSRYADWTDLNRQMIGTTQLGWLAQEMASSPAKWQVLGQQVIMAKTWLPASIQGKFQIYFEAVTSPSSLDVIDTAMFDVRNEVDIYKAEYSAALSAGTIGTYLAGGVASTYLNGAVNPAIPYAMDAWDGYPAAREMVLGAFQQAAAITPTKKLVVLSGDTHNAWHNNLTTLNGTKVGEEFATPSVSSPGWEEYFPPADFPDTIKSMLESTTAVSNVQWTDTTRRGYLKMTFTPSQAKGEFVFIDQVKTGTFVVATPVPAETRIYSGV